MAFSFPDIPNPFSSGDPAPGGPTPYTPDISYPPWTASSADGSFKEVDSKFFKYIEVDAGLWDKLLPYRLIVWDSVNSKVVNGDSKPSEIIVSPLGNGTLAFEPIKTAWEFRLPITPQQLNITDTYAINTSATLRGVIEEHSGVRFKNIAIQGTFGVWPSRHSIVEPPSTPNFLTSVFGGTLSGVNNVVSQFKSIGSAFTGAPKPLTVQPISGNGVNGPEGANSTGYYQTMMLQQFLEQYVEAKKDPSNAGWRLVFDIPKQNQSFVVTPVAFTWNENVNRPMEINYNLQLKAWRRIDLKASLVTGKLNVTPLSPGALQKLLNAISAARNTLAAAHNLIAAVRSDVDNVLDIVRQTGMFVKDIAGVYLTLKDLPSALTKDYQNARDDFLNAFRHFLPDDSPAATDASIQQTADQVATNKDQNEGLSSASVVSGQNGKNAEAQQATNPANKVFNNPQLNPKLLDIVPVSSMKLNPKQQTALDNEIHRVRSFTVADLKAMRGVMAELSSQLASSFGAGNAAYSKTYNKPAPTKRTEPMTLDEYDILQSIYDLMQVYDILTATNQLDKNQILNNMEFVQGLAQDSNIPFSISNSKVQAPVPFGLNMEGIALRYLGDAQRWLEIATLNFLQEPYIDEVGFQYNLLSNGDGRNVVVGSNQNLYVGQKISISSTVQNPTSRTILDISVLSSTSYLLTLDGEANLDIYKLADGAFIKGYLAQTTNSQKVIWVPSDQPAQPDDGISIPTSVANVDLVGVSKVDWMIQNNLSGGYDLAVNSAGDFRLAAGIPNLIQALTLKFATTQNTSYLHPDFGLPLRIGSSLSDISAAKIYSDINKMITQDSRFSGLSGLQVTLSGPSILVSAGVQVSGIKGIFPVSFEFGNN